MNSYYAALLTLYNQDYEIDEPKMRDYIQFLLSKDIKGFFPSGTTGEYVGHTMAENLHILKIVLDENKGSKPIIPCASTSNLRNTIELIKEMESYGIREVSICPPYYTPIRQCDIYDYYKKIIQETNVDIYLYNIPTFTNELQFDTFERLLTEPRIVGIKDSSGNMKTISRYITVKNSLKPEFKVMTGTDEIVLPALTVGCYGSVSALSGVLPDVYNELYRSYDNDLEYARSLQNEITNLAILCESVVFPVGYKLALNARGFDVEPFRQNVCESNKHIEDLKILIKDSVVRLETMIGGE
jgi:dihydrodipicolinate synthase/N-acetylneuraminate lyase